MITNTYKRIIEWHGKNQYKESGVRGANNGTDRTDSVLATDIGFYTGPSDSHGAHLLCYFEDSQQANATQHRNAQWWHDVGVGQNHFHYTTDDHETIEAIKQRYKIALQNRIRINRYILYGLI